MMAGFVMNSYKTLIIMKSIWGSDYFPSHQNILPWAFYQQYGIFGKLNLFVGTHPGGLKLDAQGQYASCP